MLSKIKAAKIKVNATHCLLLNFSLNTNNPVNVITTIVPTLYIGNTSTAGISFNDLSKNLADRKIKPHNYINGTIETMIEFFGKYAINDFGEIDFSGKTRILDRAEAFIMETRDYFETENYVFVHV